MHELFYQIEINCKYHNKVLLKKGSEGKQKKNCIYLVLLPHSKIQWQQEICVCDLGD